jgi:hypothetical protein
MQGDFEIIVLHPRQDGLKKTVLHSKWDDFSNRPTYFSEALPTTAVCSPQTGAQIRPIKSHMRENTFGHDGYIIDLN